MSTYDGKKGSTGGSKTPDYSINYDDERFAGVEANRQEALTELEQTYGGMIANSDKFYQDQINASKEWAETQKQNQQAQTDFAIEQIEQQKDQAKQDYTKEQSGAYVDWQQQSNQYGANAEQMAAQGMTNTGYSESSQVSMYNTYQNRVATAREVYARAVLNYDNAIKDAMLQNNAALAEIAYEALKTQLELSLQGFQYKNQLVLDKAEKKVNLENTYYQRYQDVLKQINTENALAEEVRQYDENKKLQQAQLQLQRDQFNWQKEQAAKSSSISKSSGGSSSSSKSSKSGSSKSGSSTISKNSGNSNSEKQALYDEIALISSTDRAEKFMKKHNISDGGVPLLWGPDWHKYKKMGMEGSEFEYSSYKDYVQAYLTWRVQQS